MLWLLSTSPAATKKQSLWLRKTLKKLPGLSRQFTGAVLWLGLQCYRLTLAASSWVAWRKKWTNTKLTFVAAALRFTEIRQLSSVSTARLPSVCLAISMPWRCFCLKASGQLSWWKDCPMLSKLWTMRWPALLAKNLLLQSKRKPSPHCQQSITDLLDWPKKNFLLSSMWGICISLANLKAAPKEQQTLSGLWKFTGLLKIGPSQISLLSIICLTGLSAALSAKNCWLCRLILSCRQPEMAVC